METIKQTLKVGTHRGNKRVWMQGKNLEAAGFKVGVLYTTVIVPDDKIVLHVIGDIIMHKTRKVSKKKAGGEIIPVIDMNSKAISKFFAGSDSCTVLFNNDIILILNGKRN